MATGCGQQTTTTPPYEKAIFTYEPGVEREVEFEVKVRPANGNEVVATAEELAMLTTEYQWAVDQQSGGGVAPEWTTNLPTDGGEYYSKVTFAGDNDYKEVSTLFGKGILTIERKPIQTQAIQGITEDFALDSNIFVMGANVLAVDPATVMIDAKEYPGVQFQYYALRTNVYDPPSQITMPFEGEPNATYNLYVSVKQSRNYDIAAGSTTVQITNTPVTTSTTPDYWDIYGHIKDFSGQSGSFADKGITVDTTLAGSEIQTNDNGMFIQVSKTSNVVPPAGLSPETATADPFIDVREGDNDYRNGRYIKSSVAVSPWDIESFNIGVLNDSGGLNDNYTGYMRMVVVNNDQTPNVYDSTGETNLLAKIPLYNGDQVLRVDDTDSGAFPRYRSIQSSQMDLLKRTISKFAFGGVDDGNTYMVEFKTYSDQYGTYNPLYHPGAPTITISDSVGTYSQFLTVSKGTLSMPDYGDLTGADTLKFTVDKNAVRTQLERDGIAQVSFTITFTFPEDSVGGNRVYTETITVSR